MDESKAALAVRRPVAARSFALGGRRCGRHDRDGAPAPALAGRRAAAGLAAFEDAPCFLEDARPRDGADESAADELE